MKKYISFFFLMIFNKPIQQIIFAIPKPTRQGDKFGVRTNPNWYF
jgi:hypothetical protein